MKLRAEGTKWAQNLLAQKSLAEFNNESKKKELLLNHESLEELQELLLLLRDENETLKHSISEIIESKGQDLEMYQSLLDTARLGLA